MPYRDSSNIMKKHFFTAAALWMALTGLPPAQAQELNGNAAAGAGKIAQCVGCHGIKGYHSSFPEVYRVPMIAGQSASYIVSALTAYRQGDRRHPTMRGVVGSMSDQDVADVAAYYTALGGGGGASGGSGLNRNDAATALKLIEQGGCKSCHGDNFSKPIAPGYPKIAGQHADYLLVALKAYKMAGDSPVMGRSNPVMGGIAKQFSADELKLLASYLGALPGELRTVPQSAFK